MSSLGRSVKLYLVDGSATGIITAEIMNWTGHVLSAPRTRIEAALGRDELKRTGVYFLFGKSLEDDQASHLYIGEGDEISKRIIQHNKEKDFWERLIAVTSKDMNLTKAHVRYLESRLIQIAISAKKTTLENKDKPDFNRLPEADISDMETFLAEIQLILPTIGADFLRKPQSPPSNVSSEMHSTSQNISQNKYFVLANSKAGIDARATEIDGEFVLLANSVGSTKERTSFYGKVKATRDKAMKSSLVTLENAGKNFICNEDIAFTSPSAAAVFLFGTSRNGRTDWLVEGTNVSYGQWKDQILAMQQA